MRSVSFILVIGICLCMIGCGGTREYRVVKTTGVKYNQQFPGSIALTINSEKIYTQTVGLYDYKLHLQEGLQKYYEEFLKQQFKGGVNNKSEFGVSVTVLDTSIFPVAGVIFNVTIVLKVEFTDKKLGRQKTFSIYGLGTSTDGNQALEKAINNSLWQLVPHLEEQFAK